MFFKKDSNVGPFTPFLILYIILVQSQINWSNLSTMNRLLHSVATRGRQRLETSEEPPGFNLLPGNVWDHWLCT